jgi:PAS domain S-box-containing protein
LLVENSSNPIFIYGPDETYHCANSAFARALGKEKEDVIGKGPRDFFSSEEAEKRLASVRYVFQTGEKKEVEMVVSDSSGEEKIYQAILEPLRNETGEIVLVGCIAKDVSSQKKAEALLKISEEKYRIVADFAYDWVAWRMPNGEFKHVSPSCLRITGHTSVEFINDPHLVVRITHPEDRERVAMHNKCIDNGGEIKEDFELSFRILTLGGEIRWIGHTCTPIYSEKGEYLGRRESNRDITNQKKAEELLMEAERKHVIGTVSSGFAHNFNNYLQVVCSSLELIQRHSGFPWEVIKHSGVALKKLDDMALCVRQLQSFGGKMNTGGRWEALNLNEIIDNVVIESQPIWKDKSEREGVCISIRKSYGEIPPIDGVFGKINEAVRNVIINAVEALPDGGLITLETGIVGGRVYARITDNGVGMDEKTKKMVFVPFFSTKSLQLGRGLGLSCAYTCLRDFDGEISVLKTAPKKGTTIQILFPIGTLHKKALKQVERAPCKKSARILWVDDDVSVLNVYKLTLNMLGHIAHTAESGMEALRLLEKNHYDLIITDLGMPEMNGWQFAAAVKEKDRNAKVAVVTGWGEDTGIGERVRAGVCRVIGKPLSVENLGKLIEELV